MGFIFALGSVGNKVSGYYLVTIVLNHIKKGPKKIHIYIIDSPW